MLDSPCHITYTGFRVSFAHDSNCCFNCMNYIKFYTEVKTEQLATIDEDTKEAGKDPLFGIITYLKIKADNFEEYGGKVNRNANLYFVNGFPKTQKKRIPPISTEKLKESKPPILAPSISHPLIKEECFHSYNVYGYGSTVKKSCIKEFKVPSEAIVLDQVICPETPQTSKVRKNQNNAISTRKNIPKTVSIRKNRHKAISIKNNIHKAVSIIKKKHKAVSIKSNVHKTVNNKTNKHKCVRNNIHKTVSIRKTKQKSDSAEKVKKSICSQQKSLCSTSEEADGKKVPGKGTLKRKRWFLNKLKNSDNYEDDIYEKQDLFKFQNFDEEDSNSGDMHNIPTPTWSISLSPRERSRSPSYEDCYSPTELSLSRKEAEEYQFRRIKRRKSKVLVRDGSLQLSHQSVKNENPDKLLQEACDILMKQPKAEKESDGDSESDYYFSDHEENA